MQNFLGTCLAVGILAGGFAITGDFRWLAHRASRILAATDVPDDEAPIPAAPPSTPAPATRRQRTGGPQRVELAATRPGERILVWLDAAAEPLAFDVVDPAAAAVILHGGPPRRATIADGTLVRGEQFRVITLGLAHAGSGASESLGKITSISTTPDGR